MNGPVSLDVLPLHATGTLVSADVPGSAGQRLRTLGLRPGVQVSVIQRLAGGGRLVHVAGSRLALGRDVLRGLLAEQVR